MEEGSQWATGCFEWALARSAVSFGAHGTRGRFGATARRAPRCARRLPPSAFRSIHPPLLAFLPCVSCSEADVGKHKALSAAANLRALNSSIKIETHLDGLTPANAVELISRYDVVLDASDNPATRYLVSDAAVVAGRPVVSGAALGTDGQATLYNAGADCPCYRCMWPSAPPAASCARCADAGVLGFVTGIIGSVQAGQAIKLLSGVGSTLTRRMLVYDGIDDVVRVVRLRGRSPTCVACGPDAQIRSAADVASFDYAAFVGAPPTDAPAPPLRLLGSDRRISPSYAAELLAGPSPPVLLDVRPHVQFDIVSVPGAISVPYAEIKADPKRALEALASRGGAEVLVMCRRGNDSQRAVVALDAAGVPGARDVEGGIEEWARTVDTTFPIY